MGASAQFQPPVVAATPAQQWAPRARSVQVWTPGPDGLIHQMNLETTASGFVVYTAEDARMCEIAGVEYLYLNPSQVLAMNVEDPSPPPTPLFELMEDDLDPTEEAPLPPVDGG